jgi:hypothetical protein
MPDATGPFPTGETPDEPRRRLPRRHRPQDAGAAAGPGRAPPHGRRPGGTTLFDTLGNPFWYKDADGFLSYTLFDLATGAALVTIDDVNTHQTGDFSGLPSGWVTPAGGGLNLQTQYAVDDMGRPTQETDPEGGVLPRWCQVVPRWPGPGPGAVWQRWGAVATQRAGEERLAPRHPFATAGKKVGKGVRGGPELGRGR